MDWHGFDRVLAPLARWFYPTKCVLCDRVIPQETMEICPECLTAATVFMHYPWKIPHVKQWISLWQYTGNVRDAILRYKFWHRRAYGTVLGRELGRKLAEKKVTVDVITWVPISFWRKVERGYDQTELLAQEAAYQMKGEAVPLLKKRRHNRKQSSIRGRQARIENVRGVYCAPDPEKIRGKRILLIDDVVTTGATVSEAARVLREAGAKEVSVACVACATNPQFRPK